VFSSVIYRKSDLQQLFTEYFKANVSVSWLVHELTSPWLHWLWVGLSGNYPVTCQNNHKQLVVLWAVVEKSTAYRFHFNPMKQTGIRQFIIKSPCHTTSTSTQFSKRVMVNVRVTVIFRNLYAVNFSRCTDMQLLGACLKVFVPQWHTLLY